ncbi:hypothetical protein Tco_0446129 [Tanacetum coccineum]
MQELLLQLSKDLQTLGNTLNQLKQEEQDSSQYWKPPIYYSDDDDDFYRESIDETPPIRCYHNPTYNYGLSISFSPSPIPVEDSDSLMEEIDIFLAPDDSIPSGIENDDYDSERDILFLEELLTNDSLSLSENESFHFDRYYVPSFTIILPEKPISDRRSYVILSPIWEF